MRVMLRKLLKRRHLDEKDSSFETHGRAVKSDKLERFKKRKIISDDEILAFDARMNQNPDR